MDFYVYVHKRKDTGEPFYVGKGRGDRAWSSENRTSGWRKIVAISGRTVEVVMRDMSEDAALSFEKMLISALSIRFRLVNKNKGGGGRRPKFERFYLMHNGEECWINIPRYVPPPKLVRKSKSKPKPRAIPRNTYGLTGK